MSLSFSILWSTVATPGLFWAYTATRGLPWLVRAMVVVGVLTVALFVAAAVAQRAGRVPDAGSPTGTPAGWRRAYRLADTAAVNQKPAGARQA